MSNSTEIKQDKMYSYAFSIKEGMAKGKYLYCLEDDRFYHYKEGYWESLFDIDFLGRIQENIIDITKYSLSRRKQIVDNYKVIGRKNLSEFNWANLINLKNGMVSPYGGKLENHDYIYYSTIRLPYIYAENEKCDLWIKSLNEIFENDEDKINILQEYFGYCLTKDTTQIMALLLLGESKSGKSTIVHVLRNMIGIPNCSSVSMKFIANPQYTPLLINKLVNIDADVSEKSQDFEAEFKIITSGEPITCNQKFVPTFEFIPYCKIVMAANKFPRITDHSSAFYNRLLVIPCDRVFSPSEQNRTLKTKLLEELPGILQWAIRGLNRLTKRGMFEEKDFIKNAIEELREESNPIESFFREHIEAENNSNSYIIKEDLYKKYCDWAFKNGYGKMGNNKFGSMVYQKYSKYTPKNTMSHVLMKRVWKNIRYIEDKELENKKIEIEIPAETINPHTHKAIEVGSKQEDIDWSS
jgi:putative DNA primase/helicase